MNFTLSVTQPPRDKHLFISILLASGSYYIDKPLVPEIPLAELKIDDILLSDSDYVMVRRDCIQLIGAIICKKIPALSFIEDYIRPHIGSQTADGASRIPTEVQTIPVMEADEAILQYVNDIGER